jgi:hypothetical protein
MARKKPIISPLGQWAYPGEVTIIPSSDITMKGVNYPVLGIDDLGNSQMMMPGHDYTFPGDYVTEIPQMGKGGLAQWFDEKWVDVKTGKACGRSGKDKDGRPYPACRPSKRVNETTPKTTSEMSSSEKAKFKREKTSGKRIDYNHKRREEGGEIGWLDEYQVGGWAGWTPNVGKPYVRTSPAGNAGYTDNTRVVNQNTNVTAANRKAAEAAEYAKRVGSISQGKTKSAYEKAREASSLVAQAQERKGSADPLDYVLDMVNPATYGFAGIDLVGNTAMGVNNLAKGNFSEAAGNTFDAGMNALYILPAAAELRGPLRSAGKYLTTQTPLKNTYKYNPWAFNPNEANWYRQVGKSAIDDALETRLVREAGEEVSPRMYQEFEDQLVRMQGSGPEAMLASRRPISPFFSKGELFYPMGRKPTITKSGKISKNPAGKGDADYLIETNLPNESFQPAYVKGMSLGTPTEIGQTAILKPNPALRDIENFNLYKQDWLRGYKPVDVSSAQPSMNLSNTDGVNIAREFLGELVKGNQNRKAIAEGNAWLKNWIDDPITQTKIDTDLGWIPQRSNILKDTFSLGYEQAKSFTPVSKEYPLLQQLNDYFIGKPHIHSGNTGVSYLHSRDPYMRLISEQFNNPRLKASWISRNPSRSKPVRRSTTVHEGTHDWTSDFLLRESGQMGDIRNLYSNDVRNLTDQYKSLTNSGINPFEIMGRENATLGYLADPTEVHARIMQLRQLMKMTPEQSVMVTPEKAADIITKVQNPKNTKFIDPRFLDVIDKDPKKLATLFNRLWAVPAVAAASQLPEQKNGGWLDIYQDGGENLPELNSKIDIANFYKNPLSEKYGIYQDPEDDTYKYYLKSGDESSILQSGPDLSNINSRRLAEINSQKGSLSNAQLANIKNVSPVILPEQKQRILRDKVYYDQEDLMEQAMSESPIPSVKTPSYSEILESDPEFKRVMTEKPKPVAPIKPKPVSADTPLVPIGNAPRAIVKPAVKKVVAKNNIVNLADLTITAADKAYLNKVEEYCPGGNCLETTRNAYDMLPGRIQGIPTSSDIWSNDLKIHSKKGTPTANDIKQYPYFAGDSGSGTVDSWDIHGVIVANGGKNLFNINNPTPIDYKQIPVGAVIGWGPANKKDSSYSGRSKGYNKQFGMQPSHHSTMVTGYSETGEPIVYDGYLKKYMTLTEAKANIGSSLSYELENISAPKSILNNTQDNLRSQGVLLNYIPPTNVNPNKILAAANQPWAQIPEGSAKRAPRFNKQMMTEFNSALMNNKGELMRNLNISSEKYDELAKVALAISAQESEGGGALGVIDGSTIGMTQLNPDNIFKDDKLKKAASKPYILNDGGNNILKPELIKTPSGSAVATMIYLSKLDKDSERYYNEGKVPKDRSFTKNSNIIKDALRSNTSKYNADGFFVEEANKRIDLSPFEGGMLSSPDPVAAQKLLNKTAGVADKYKVSVKNGSLVVTMKTKGNADLSVAERIGYAWQSPNTLKSGDAQGDSVYTRRIKNYYDLLNNTTPTYRKEGGETGWLKKYK